MPNSIEFIVPPCDETPSIVYQDDDLLGVSKPAGLLSVPGRHPANRDSLIGRLQQQQPEARIVHRLDMATSGLMLIALNKNSHRRLSQLFERREITKQYHAVVSGCVEASQGLVDLPLACDWPRRPRQHINFDHGKAAQTFYKCLRRSDTQSTLLLSPITGRSHQLRVHCASIGHPILGCEFYADEPARQASPRLLLHASALRLQHPITGTLCHLGNEHLSPPLTTDICRLAASCTRLEKEKEKEKEQEDWAVVETKTRQSGTQIVLQPNRSASWQSNRRILCTIAGFNLVFASGFLSISAWMILPFIGLELLLLWALLRRVFEKLQIQQVIYVDGESVHIESGYVRAEKYWQWPHRESGILVLEHNHPWAPLEISVCYGGKAVRLGAFLNRDDSLLLLAALKNLGLGIQQHSRPDTLAV